MKIPAKHREVRNRTNPMKTTLSMIVVAGLTSCGNMETRSGPYVNEPALQQAANTMERASAYERQGDSPRDAWERARLNNGFGGPSGMMGDSMTPIFGYGWSGGSGGGR